MDIISIILFHFLRLVYIYWEPIFLRLQCNLKCPDIRILNAVYILFKSHRTTIRTKVIVFIIIPAAG